MGQADLNTLEFQRAYVNGMIKLRSLSDAANIYQAILPSFRVILSGRMADPAKAKAIFEDIGDAELILVKALSKQSRYSEAGAIYQSATQLLAGC